MSNITEAADVQCPYFITAKGKGGVNHYISCEGIECAEYTTLRFKDREAMDRYIYTHCINYPNCCPLSWILEAQNH